MTLHALAALLLVFVPTSQARGKAAEFSEVLVVRELRLVDRSFGNIPDGTIQEPKPNRQNQPEEPRAADDADLAAPEIPPLPAAEPSAFEELFSPPSRAPAGTPERAEPPTPPEAALQGIEDPISAPLPAIHPLWIPEPAYPSLALQRGWEGEVWVELSVRSDGSVAGILITQSSRKLFEASAAEAASQARFTPWKSRGSVETRPYLVKFRFALDKAP